ncbi:MAG: acetyl-CoA synthetase, partial [Eggerthellaceae bacterium]|nr:acetyl-CoA synthetase [Eggerthellaceae bacterium]
EKYILELRNAHGKLEFIKIKCPQSFNFAYGTLDTIAEEEAKMTAMLWTNEDGEKHNFSYAEIKHWPDKTANYFKSLGIGKGDFDLATLL